MASVSGEAEKKKDLTIDEQIQQYDQPYDLTNVQMKWLMDRLSPEDKENLGKDIKQCGRNMFLKQSRKLLSLI